MAPFGYAQDMPDGDEMSPGPPGIHLRIWQIVDPSWATAGALCSPLE